MHFSNFPSWSKLSLITACLFVLVFRSLHIEKQEITWDIFGYYLPLPAAFIYNDPLLNDRAWVDELNDEKGLTRTVYQITTTENGEPMYFFLFGMSFFYAFFFLIGHLCALAFGFPPDGFSDPYQISLVFGCMLYTFIGLFYLRKVLLHFTSEKTTALVLLALVFGTNYVHHMTLKNLETVNILFMLSTIVVWNTIQWHQTFKLKHCIAVILGVAFMAIVKPSEILFALFPLLYGIVGWKSILQKIAQVFTYWWQILFAIFLASLFVLPQLFYWHVKTGELLYDTYKNPGVGLDFFNPHMWEVLFSYRKGWLVYTPIMIFSFVGFRQLLRKQKSLVLPIIVTLVATFYIVSSWTEWWYGAGFSIRPMITYYPILAIPFALFVESLLTKGMLLKWGVGILALFMLFLNQFQWWQLRAGILDPYRMTKAYYWAIFLKGNVSSDQEKLMRVKRDFYEFDSFTDSTDYQSKTLINEMFDNNPRGELISGPNEIFALPVRFAFKDLTNKDHVWVEVSINYSADNTGEPILVAMCLERENGAYGYKKFELLNETETVTKKVFYYLTPEIRDTRDTFKLDVWKRSPCNLKIQDFKVKIFEPKRSYK
jgi:hypothetical protein